MFISILFVVVAQLKPFMSRESFLDSFPKEAVSLAAFHKLARDKSSDAFAVSSNQ
ncbi:hypothetical protein GF325_05310 [Candidatus Bathyarchaeota archaeon]|nr:hypothetical protein [Candidatus Bathyarchaeota archaeon]